MTACAWSSAVDHAAVDRNHQSFELVAQIAHGGDARHARTALQGVQRALQFGDGLLVLAIVIPGGERQSRRPRAARSPPRSRYWRSRDRTPRRLAMARGLRLGGRRQARGASAAVGRTSSRPWRFAARGPRSMRLGAPALELGTIAEHCAGLGGRCASSRIDLRFEHLQALEQRGLLGEERSRFVDVRDDVVDGAHRIREHGQRRHPTCRGRCRTPCACTWLSGSVMRMPWRASAIFELPLRV